MSQNATPATEFAPWRHLTQPCQCDLQKTLNATRLKCCACHAKNDDGPVQSAAPATKTATHLLKTSQKSIAPATQNDFRHVTEHVWMSPSATPATRNEATERWKPPKMTPPAELTIGKAYGPHTNGCRRLRTVGQRRANTPSTPRPPEWNGNPCYAFGKKTDARNIEKQQQTTLK